MPGKKVVVFHQGALGDFLLAAAAVDELAKTQGFSRVDFWSKPDHVSLLAQKGYLGNCYSCDSPLAAALLHDTLWREARLPGFLLEADSVFIFGQTGTRLLAERLSALLSAGVYWIQSFPVTKESPVHVSVFLSNQLAALDLPIAGSPLLLVPPDSEKKAARDLLRKLRIGVKPVLLHPGSGGRRKVWPLANWGGLTHWMCREPSLQPLLSIGPADEYLDQFCRAMRKSGLPVVKGLTPLRLSALLSLCRLYIGCDSGVSHLAASVGVPTIAIFGPTDPRVWAPRGRRAVTLRRQWKEEDLLKWQPSEIPCLQDEQIVSTIQSFLKSRI